MSDAVCVGIMVLAAAFIGFTFGSLWAQPSREREDDAKLLDFSARSALAMAHECERLQRERDDATEEAWLQKDSFHAIRSIATKHTG